MNKASLFGLENALKTSFFILWPSIVFIPYSMPVLLVGMCLLMIAYLYRQQIDIIWPDKNELLLMGGFVLWIFLSVIWSFEPSKSFVVAVSLTTITLAGYGVVTGLRSIPPNEINTLVHSLMKGAMLALLLLCLEVLTQGALLRMVKTDVNVYEFHKPAVILVSILWLVAAVLIQRRQWWLLMALLSGFVTIQFYLESDAITAVILTGVTSILFFALHTRLMMKTLGVLSFTGILGAPWIFTHLLNPRNLEKAFLNVYDSSYHHRLHIWEYVSKKILQKPFAGYGLDASRHPFFKEHISWMQPYWDKVNQEKILYMIQAFSVSLHPHNAPLQCWLELGVIGAFLLAGIVVMAAFKMAKISMKWDRWTRASYCATLPSIMLIGCVSYGLWQNWWFATLFMAYAVSVLIQRYLTAHSK